MRKNIMFVYTKKIIIIVSLLFAMNICLLGQDDEKVIFIFLNPKSEKIEFLYDKPNGIVTYKIRNNIIDECFINLKLIDKTDSAFLVVAYQLGLDERKGWIKKSSNLGIYTRNYSNEPIILYSKPNYNEERHTVSDHYFTDVCQVLDFCNNGWVRIIINLKGKMYDGWIPPEMQCANIYSTCN